MVGVEPDTTKEIEHCFKLFSPCIENIKLMEIITNLQIVKELKFDHAYIGKTSSNMDWNQISVINVVCSASIFNSESHISKTCIRVIVVLNS